MERLTKYGYQFSLLNVLQGLTRYTEIDEILNQLAAYEDTSLSPADIADLTARAEAAEAERDAAVEDLNHLTYAGPRCEICKHYLDENCITCEFEWRGPEAGKGAK